MLNSVPLSVCTVCILNGNALISSFKNLRLYPEFCVNSAGAVFTYKFISDTELCPFDKALSALGINHVLIPPRTPWHNGKVERSHRNDQRYFYDWEKFKSVEELNIKLKKHLNWSNNKTMRTLGRKSPFQILKEKLSA